LQAGLVVAGMNSLSAQFNRDAYIDLLKRAITNYACLGGESSHQAWRSASHYDLEKSQWKIDPLARPLTLLTKSQLDLIEQAMVLVTQRGVPGDFLEAGIWRGGAVILMRAVLNAYAIEGRKVYAADSSPESPRTPAR
jgi:O-methyltransferase/8-demethyl-8-(2,3-dimethoxy-alpha-L-rhamnosyl)tetracenomycin-C 4'-O-methyltransferase